MGKGARSGMRRRAGGGGGGVSKRPRRVTEEEEEEEEEAAAEAVEGKEAEAEEEAVVGEDYCFVCKDGGELRVCDYRSCHKAYHPGCVGKDADFLNSDEEFICEWHNCFICKGRSRYYCFCCPLHTFCQGCVTEAEFVPVLRKTKGFCNNCLRMVIMIEKNVDVDSDGERADFSDRTTYEFLFKEYWEEIVKDKEGMTLDILEKAYASLKRGLNCKQDQDFEKLPDEERNSDDDFLGNSDDGDGEPSFPSNLNGASKKIKSFLKEGKSKKNGFVGWGSKELINFLSSIGKDTSKSLDQFGAAEVVKEYIRQKNLLPKDKKKLVICDQKLHCLFRKSKVRYNRIYSLLERHIAANMTSDDETLGSEECSDSVLTKKARTVSYGSSTPKRTPEINKRCFASLVRDNIKLIYLKRSLVIDLLKEPDSFESKVIGCFVRVKNDPKDYCFHMHKKLYQLGQVTGIRKSSEYKIKDISTDVLLCISNLPDAKISMLSDEDFEEEECEDLRLLAQNESFKRHTVGDLEEKARSLRRDIVSHWINKELQRLERLIEKANEKGWHNEKHEYLDKKQLLRKPCEQQRLLEEVPQVIPETEDGKDAEFQVTAQDFSVQKSTAPYQGTSGERVISLNKCSEEKYQGTNGRRASCMKSRSQENFKGTDWEIAFSLNSCSEEKGTDGDRALSFKSLSEAKSEATKADTHVGTAVTQVRKRGTEAIDGGMRIEVITIDDDKDDHPREKGGQTAVVDLEADDAGDTHPVQHETNNILHRGHEQVNVKAEISQRKCMWYYIDPQGDEQGPFTMEHLRHWWNNGFFSDDFKVWRTGQTSDCAILLTDALQVTR